MRTFSRTLLSILIIFWGATLVSQDSRTIYNQATSAFQAKQYGQSLQLYKQYVSLVPDDKNAYFNLGLCYAKLNQTDDALTAFNRCKGSEKLEAKSNYMIGFINNQRGRYAVAIEAFNKACEIDPQSSYYLALAQLYANINEHQKTVETCNMGLLYDPEHTELKNLRGTAYYKLGKNEMANDDLKKLGRKSKTYAVLAMRAKSSIKSEDWVDAINNATTGIVEFPEEPEFYYLRGYSHMKIGNYEEGDRDFQTCIDMGYKLETSKHNRAICLRKQGLDEKAAEQFRKLEEKDYMTYAELGNVKLTQGKYREAITMYESSVNLNDQVAEVHYNLAMCYYKIDKTGKSCNSLRRAMKLNYTAAREDYEGLCK